MNEWISVEDRLPDKADVSRAPYMRFLCSSGDSNMFAVKYCPWCGWVLVFDDKTWWCKNPDCDWMQGQ